MSRVGTSFSSLVSLCERRGFARRIPCIVAGKQSFDWIHGAPGSLLRQNILNEWRKTIHRGDDQIFMVKSCPYPPTSSADNRSETKSSPEIERNNTIDSALHQHYISSLQLVGHRLPFGLAEVAQCQDGHWHQKDEDVQEDKSFLRCPGEQELHLFYFVAPGQVNQELEKWHRTRLKWWKQFAGATSKFTSENNSENNQNMKNITFHFPWGMEPVEVICNHGDKPLQQLQRKTGISCQGHFGKKYVLPHVIECRISLQRGITAYLWNGYQCVTSPGDEGEVTSEVLKLHPKIAPYSIAIAVAGLYGPTRVREVASHVTRELKKAGFSVLDLRRDNTNVQQLISMHDEIGIPFTLIMNEKTLENGVALLRNRDTLIQEQISIVYLKDRLHFMLSKEFPT